MPNKANRPWRPVQDVLDRLSDRSKNGMSFNRREEMLMPNETKFGFLESAQIRFRSMKERSVKLAYASFYEQLYEEGGCGNLEAEIFPCMAIGIERSRHQGHFTEYLVMVQIEGEEKEEDMAVLPKIDKEDVDLEVSIRYGIPEVSRHAFREAWLVELVTSSLYDRLKRTLNNMGAQRAEPKRLKAEMMARISEVYVHSGDKAKSLEFLEGAAEAMEKVYRDRDDPYDQGETWDAWRSKIGSFVGENIDRFKHPPIELREEPLLRGCRIEVPEALRHIASALFVATAPQIPVATEQDKIMRLNWPGGEAGPAPFIRFRIPVIDADVDLAATANVAERLAQADEQFQSTKIFKASIVRTSLDTTMKMELAAIAKLTCYELDTSEFACMSRYLLDFRGQIQTCGATETFPVLKAVAGYFITDGTAPTDEAGGFSTKALSQVLASIAAPLQPLVRRSETIDALRQEFQRLDADQKAVFSSLDSLPYGMLNVIGAAGTGKTHVCLLIVLMAGLGIVVDGGDDGDDENIVAQALVCGVTNAQVDDLYERFHQLISRCQLPLKVVRVGTMGRELANATNRGFVEDEDAAFDPEHTRGPSTTFDHEVSQIMRVYRENKSAQGRIHGGVHAVSEIAYTKLEAYNNGLNRDDEYSDIVCELSYIHQLRKIDRRIFTDDQAERYRKPWKELIMEIIADADICVATPVAAKQLADMDERPFEPQIVWSDDAGRTTEASGLAPLAFFPEARLCVLSGNPESEVVTPSVQGARKPEGSKMHFVNRYALQLGMSILKRMERGGAPVCRLRVVHEGAFDTS